MMSAHDHKLYSVADGHHVVIHTDGACIGNPGPGGWSAIASHWDGSKLLDRKAISGGTASSTSNSMELTAAIEGLKALDRRDRPVFVKSDSQYVVKGMTEWLPNWKKSGWKTGSGKPVKNQDLWVQLDRLAAEHDAEFHWVRGHNGDPLNEKADRLANEAARQAAWPPL